MPNLDLALATARRAVEAASRVALPHFHRGVPAELKADRTPVTIADRESEQAIFEVIRGAFPDDALVGEETGVQEGRGGASGRRWIVDPLDGTRGFTRGEAFWGPLVALEEGGLVLAGAMALPVTGEVYCAARGLGAWRILPGVAPAPLRVSGTSRWEEATFSMGEPRVLLAPPLVEGVVRLATTCARTRCHGDLAGFTMVLTGRAEAWVEAGVHVWDLAPMQVLIEEAGGAFTDLHGHRTIASGDCVASNGLLHEHVLAALGPGSAGPP